MNLLLQIIEKSNNIKKILNNVGMNTKLNMRDIIFTKEDGTVNLHETKSRHSRAIIAENFLIPKEVH